MGEQTIEVMVDGGRASAGPPLGTSLGPMKINVANVVQQINEKTKSLEGMKVPVKVTVDTDTKEFQISVGTPPVAALVKKELGLEKGSGEAGKVRAGDLSMEQAKEISRTKFGSDGEKFLSQVRGTCRSMGITIGQGAVTKEELKKYEEMEKQKEAEEKVKEEAAAESGEAKPGAESAEEPEKPEETTEESEKKTE